jgi:hypothetical protein
MQATICHDFTRQKMLNTTPTRESIYKLNDVKHHTDNHNARYHRERYTVAKQTNLLFQEAYIAFDEPTMLYATAQSKQGAVGRIVVNSLIAASFWSLRSQ